MSDVEGIGEIVTGAAIARAVEPGRGAADTDRDGHTHEKNCLNCGTELTGAYCHACGQHAHVPRTIGAWWHDFLHSVLHLDGKFWRTLPMLVWRPGELTHRYAHGERAKFISPLALFLFTVFLMFAVFSFLGGPFATSPNGMNARAEITRETEAVTGRLADLEQRRIAIAESGQPLSEIDAQIADVREELRALETARSIVVVPGSVPDGQVQTVNLRDANFGTGLDWLDAGIEKARENPELLLYKVQANAYKFSWALIPLSLPFVWVMFLHRKRYRRDFSGYDHLVFVTYSIAFMSMLLVTYLILERFGAAPLASLAMLVVPPLHMFRQLRGAYGISAKSALWRTAILMVFAVVALALFGLLLLSLGVVG